MTKQKIKPLNFLKILARYRKIIKATLIDNRVPKLLKRGLIGTLIYVIFPLDVLPDVIPFVGQIDDIGLIIVVLEWIKKNLPDTIMNEIDGKIIKGN